MKKGMLKKLAMGLAVLSAAMVLGGCGDQKKVADTDKKTDAKVLRVATNCTFPPFQTIDEKTGKPVGIDIDLAEYIGKKMDRKVEFQDMKFKALVPTLESGRADMVVAGLSPTDERSKVVSFSKTYYYPPKAIVAKKGTNYTSLELLKKHKVGTTMGTTYANDLKKVPGIDVVELDSSLLAVQDVLNGRLDAALVDGTHAIIFCKEHPELEMHMLALSTDKNETFSIALPKDSPDVAKVNEIIDEMNKNGEFRKILVKYLGEEQTANYYKMMKDQGIQ